MACFRAEISYLGAVGGWVEYLGCVPKNDLKIEKVLLI